MAKRLHISPKLSLPQEAVAETFAILAMRGAGKSTAAVAMAEEMFKAGLHWVAIDPKGDWWGIRSSSDGKSEGLPVPIFGGRHGDVPLEPDAGAFIADLVVDQTLTCVLDLSEFTEGEKIRFLAGAGRADGFASRLYRRKDRDQTPTHVFLEEAHDYIPQQAMRDKAKLVHDCSRIATMGRSRGLGCTSITQRSARLHKDVLTQIDTLIAMRTTAPQDRKAVMAWVEYHAQAKELVESLPGLKNGEAWVWSPERLGVMERIRFRRRETFDSGSTPTVGKRGRAPATLADVDVSDLREQMAATIEKAKADDPRELRRKIAELERTVRGQSSPEPERVEVEVPVEVPVIREHDVDQLEKILAPAMNGMSAMLADAQVLLRELRDRAGKSPIDSDGKVRGVPPPRPTPGLTAGPVRAALLPTPPKPRPAEGAGDLDLSSSQRRILDALAALETFGASPADRTQLALFARASPNSSGYTHNLGALRSAGLIDYPTRGAVALTEAGRPLADVGGTPTNAADLQDFIRSLVGPSKWKLIDELIGVYPEALSKEELAERAGVSSRSSGYTHNLGSLRSLRLIDYPAPGYVAALPVLFLEGAPA